MQYDCNDTENNPNINTNAETQEYHKWKQNVKHSCTPQNDDQVTQSSERLKMFAINPFNAQM